MLLTPPSQCKAYSMPVHVQYELLVAQHLSLAFFKLSVAVLLLSLHMCLNISFKSLQSDWKCCRNESFYQWALIPLVLPGEVGSCTFLDSEEEISCFPSSTPGGFRHFFSVSAGTC